MRDRQVKRKGKGDTEKGREEKRKRKIGNIDR